MRFEQNLIVIVIALAFLTGCASSPPEWDAEDPKRSLAQLCYYWKSDQDRDAFRKIVQHAGFSYQELDAISQSHVFIGMSEAAANCSIWRPYDPDLSDEAFHFVGDIVAGVLTLGLVQPTDHETGTILSATGDWGNRTVWRYYGSEAWVFFENGLLVNIQVGSPEDVFPDAEWDFLWGWEYDDFAFDFESLKPPTGSKWQISASRAREVR
ncbi:MAG: hypothetical protein QNI99_21220 [Woeseiaceae bacterium]|nr:hypothetical protein [Woeseiaceae bacterium]